MKKGNEKGSVTALVAGIIGVLGNIGDFFARAALAPDRWLSGTPAKRQRIGSKRKPNPEGYAIGRDKKRKVKERHMRGTPGWDNPHTLMARGNAYALAEVMPGGRDLGLQPMLPVSGPYFGALELTVTEARPHGSKGYNKQMFEGTEGNHGQTAARRLRRMFARGGVDRKMAVVQAKRLGVIL